MIQDIGLGRFNNQYKNVKAKAGDTAIVFQGTSKRDDAILAKLEWGSSATLSNKASGKEAAPAMPAAPTNAALPTVGEVCSCGYTPDDFIYLFAIDDQRFFLLDRYSESIPGIAEAIHAQKQSEADAAYSNEIANDDAVNNAPTSNETRSNAVANSNPNHAALADYEFAGIRTLTRTEPMELGLASITAYHLFDWYRINQFCGRCGAPMKHDSKERAKRCSCCSNMVFPKICPACIIAVRNGDTVITSRYAGRAYKGRALLAGFCEIGETAEETVAREVMEEVGLKVKNITYFASQPWGVESDLLLGYYCDVDGSTDIHIDETELAIAEWTPRGELEPDPSLRTLTATMLDAFRRGEI